MLNKTVWPGWETVRVIGRGSYGAVYEVRRNIFGQTESAAVKCISIPQNESDIAELRADGYDNSSITETYRERMQRITEEYSLMRKLNGTANVVSCDDVHCEPHADGIGWDIYIRMELLRALPDVLPQQIDDALAVKIGSDICHALKDCSRYNIVHRDIKPQNLFLSPNGDYKLGDFGIARTMKQSGGGTRIGTPKYMAPEVYNSRPYNSQADIYSLGLLLYWLMNERRLPFVSLPPRRPTTEEESDACRRRLGGEAFPPPVHGSRALQYIIMKACAYDPAKRYQSAEEMLADLQGVLQPGYMPSTAGRTPERSITGQYNTIQLRGVGDDRAAVRAVGSGNVRYPDGNSMPGMPSEPGSSGEDRFPEPQTASASRRKRIGVVIIAEVVVLVLIAAALIVQVVRSSRTYPADVGDTITFGSYNGSDIVWRVLDRDSRGRVLVISEQALAELPYNSEAGTVTWEESSLRYWLNGSFYYDAFTPEERKQIQSTQVENEENPNYKTYAGPDTEDHIFLLSLSEEMEYFSTDADAIAYLPGRAECWWWLRSPGIEETSAAAVNYNGETSATGAEADREDGAVRPAMWIEIAE